MATTPLQFMSLLTPQEQGAITAAALQSPQVMLFLLMLAASTEVDPSDPRTTGGIAAMIGAGLLSKDRGDTLLAGIANPPKPPALTVVSSVALPGSPQPDGRFWVTEVHTLSDGSVRTYTALDDAGTDYNAVMAERAAALNAELAAA